MMFTKKISILITAAIIILIVTNPSYEKFENFSKELPIAGIYINTKEVFNGLLFSIYTKEIAHTDYVLAKHPQIVNITTVKYIGICSNFLKIYTRSSQVKALTLVK